MTKITIFNSNQILKLACDRLKYMAITKNIWSYLSCENKVYQVRLDSQEKETGIAVFVQFGISPAQAVRLFFKQVVFY